MSYKARAEEARKNRSFTPPEGKYKIMLKDWKYGLSKVKQQPMFTLQFKVIEGPDEATTEKYKGSDKRLTCRFHMSVPHSFDSFLVFLEDLGVDLSAVRSYDEDPDYRDFRDIMEAAERKSPEMVGQLKHQENSTQYYNLYLQDIPKIFGEAAAQPTTQPAASVAPPAAPAPAPAYAPPPPPPAYPAAPAAPTYAPVTPTESPAPAAPAPVATPPAQMPPPATPKAGNWR